MINLFDYSMTEISLADVANEGVVKPGTLILVQWEYNGTFLNAAGPLLKSEGHSRHYIQLGNGTGLGISCDQKNLKVFRMTKKPKLISRGELLKIPIFSLVQLTIRQKTNAEISEETVCGVITSRTELSNRFELEIKTPRPGTEKFPLQCTVFIPTVGENYPLPHSKLVTVEGPHYLFDGE